MTAHSNLSDAVLDEAVKGTRELLAELLCERARRAALVGLYYCAVCRSNFVTPAEGQDTCADCLRRM